MDLAGIPLSRVVDYIPYLLVRDAEKLVDAVYRQPLAV
jgi:hypothetical protein